MNNVTSFSDDIRINVIIIVVAISIVLIQGTWIFRDAQKRGIFPWFWGLWGLIHAPLPLIVYYFCVIRKDKKNKNM